MPTRLNEVELFVTDVDAALLVYRDILGVPLQGHAHEPGDPIHFHAMFGEGESMLFFSVFPAGDEPVTRTSIGFAVDDLDATHRAVQQAGLRVINDVESRPWGTRTALYEDPAGNRLWLSQDAPT